MRTDFLNSKTINGVIHAFTVLIISTLFYQQTSKVTSGERTCVASYDGFGYYLYLAAIADQGTLDVSKEWAQNLQNRYCSGVEAYQLVQRENGHYLNMYHMGLSVVLAPSFLIGHFWASTAGYPTDGMSFPYQVTFILNAWLFFVLGWYYLRKLLLLFFLPRDTAILTMVLLIGTNYLITTTEMFVLQHEYVFALVAAFLYYLFRYRNDHRFRFVGPILLGLIVFIRPTHIVLGCIPALLLYDKSKGLRNWIKELIPYLVAGFLWQVPQILYWKIVGGTWFEMNLHVNEIILFDAHFTDFLFSYRKGWLLYTPLFVLLPLGFWKLYQYDIRMFYSFIVTSVLSIWFMAGWECWWYASSFGQRPMVDIYPLLILPLAFFMTTIQKPIWKVVLSVFVVFCVVLNLFQSVQFKRSIIADDRMTKDQYWAVFGELDPTVTNRLRLIVNESDKNWMENRSEYLKLGYHFEQKVLLNSTKTITCPAGEDWGFEHITLLDHLQTEETELKAELAWNVEDSTGSVSLCMEVANKHNVYNWNTIELALLKPKNDSLNYTFTLPSLHHDYDYLQIYLVNRSGKAFHLKRFKLTASSLIRE